MSTLSFVLVASKLTYNVDGCAFQRRETADVALVNDDDDDDVDTGEKAATNNDHDNEDATSSNHPLATRRAPMF